MAKRKKNTLIFVLAGLTLLLLAYAVFQKRGQSDAEEVTVEEVEEREIMERVAASGKIYPETEVKISSDVSGEVVQLMIEEGDSVVSGQLLAKVDPDAFQSAVERSIASVNNAKAQAANAKAGIEQSKAQIAQATAEVERVQSQIVNAKAIHERNIPLIKDGVISQADFDQSLSSLQSLEGNLKSAKANLESAKASKTSAIESANAAGFTVKSMEASLKEMKTNLSRTSIYAPHNGIVSQLNIELGERVVGTAQMAGTEIMRIANLNAMEVQVDVSENDVLRVSLNDEVEIEVDAYIGRKFIGKVTQIANSASSAGSLTTDQVTNFVVKISVDPASYQDLISKTKPYPFRPGMSASVEITTRVEAEALSVPIQAVTTREEKEKKKKGEKKKASNARKVNTKKEDLVKEVVFVIRADTVAMLEVKTGIQDDSYIQVLNGLEVGDQVITGPYSAVSKKLEEGDEVKVVDEEDLYKNKKK